MYWNALDELFGAKATTGSWLGFLLFSLIVSQGAPLIRLAAEFLAPSSPGSTALKTTCLLAGGGLGGFLLLAALVGMFNRHVPIIGMEREGPQGLMLGFLVIGALAGPWAGWLARRWFDSKNLIQWGGRTAYLWLTSLLLGLTVWLLVATEKARLLVDLVQNEPFVANQSSTQWIHELSTGPEYTNRINALFHLGKLIQIDPRVERPLLMAISDEQLRYNACDQLAKAQALQTEIVQELVDRLGMKLQQREQSRRVFPWRDDRGDSRIERECDDLFHALKGASNQDFHQHVCRLLGRVAAIHPDELGRAAFNVNEHLEKNCPPLKIGQHFADLNAAESWATAASNAAVLLQLGPDATYGYFIGLARVLDSDMDDQVKNWAVIALAGLWGEMHADQRADYSNIGQRLTKFPDSVRASFPEAIRQSLPIPTPE